MKSKVLWTLVMLNVVLLVTFALQMMGNNPAMAQPAARRPGEYLMIPGLVSGQPSSFVYVLDTTNGLLGVMTLNARKKLEGMKPVDLGRVFERAAAVGNGGKKK